MAPRAMTEDQILASIKVTAVDAPVAQRQPRPSGPRVPELPAIPSLVEEVWDSYNSDGKWKIVSIPESFVDRMRQELQQARRYLEFEHRNDEVQIDIRGLTRPEMKVIDPADPALPSELERYKKYVKAGQVGLLWRARPPELRGIRAQRAAEQGIQTRTNSRAEYKREWRKRKKLEAAARERNAGNRVMDPFKN